VSRLFQSVAEFDECHLDRISVMIVGKFEDSHLGRISVKIVFKVGEYPHLVTIDPQHASINTAELRGF